MNLGGYSLTAGSGILTWSLQTMVWYRVQGSIGGQRWYREFIPSQPWGISIHIVGSKVLFWVIWKSGKLGLFNELGLTPPSPPGVDNVPFFHRGELPLSHIFWFPSDWFTKWFFRWPVIKLNQGLLLVFSVQWVHCLAWFWWSPFRQKIVVEWFRCNQISESYGKIAIEGNLEWEKRRSGTGGAMLLGGDRGKESDWVLKIYIVCQERGAIETAKVSKIDLKVVLSESRKWLKSNEVNSPSSVARHDALLQCPCSGELTLYHNL